MAAPGVPGSTIARGVGGWSAGVEAPGDISPLAVRRSPIGGCFIDKRTRVVGVSGGDAADVEAGAALPLLPSAGAAAADGAEAGVADGVAGGVPVSPLA